MNNRQQRSVSKRVAVIGMTAALYFVLTFAFSDLAFREIQFRLSEILCLLGFVNPVFAPGVILGCFLSNLLLSPLGLPDIVFGTLHTALSMWLITKSNVLPLACAWPVLLCVIVSAELVFFIPEIPKTVVSYWTTTATVMAGEAAVLFLVGLPLFKLGIMKNKRLMELIKEI